MKIKTFRHKAIEKLPFRWECFLLESQNNLDPYIWLIAFHRASGEENAKRLIDFALSTKLLGSMSLSDQNARDLFRHMYTNKAEEATGHQNYIKLASILPKIRKVVNNLYSSLNNFMEDNCLIVLKNFEHIDINPTIKFPWILRHQPCMSPLGSKYILQ